MIPVVHRRADNDHRLAVGLIGVVGELSGDGDELFTRHTSDGFLPGRCVGCVIVVIERTRAEAAINTVLGNLQIKHGGDHDFARRAFFAERNGDRRHFGAIDVALLLIVWKVRRGGTGKVGECNVHHRVRLLAVFHHRQFQFDVAVVVCFLVFQVPFADVGATIRPPAETDRPIRQNHLAGHIEGECFPIRIVGLAEVAVEITGAQVAIRHQHLATVIEHFFLEHDQHWQVGVASRVIVKVGRAVVKVKLAQHHVAHGHCHGSVGALLGVHPDVGQLGDFGVVGRDRDRLGAFVAHLGEEMRVRCACLRHVAAPGDDIAAVEPVG